jgi:ATP-dependent Clp protease ATP-binding subunit ClpC
VYYISRTTIGHEFFVRAGADPETLHEFLTKKEGFKIYSVNELVLPEETFEGLMVALFSREDIFKQFLGKLGIIKEEDVHTLAYWVTRNQRTRRDKEWWWVKENLARIQGIGRDWAYAYTWKLDKFSKTITESSGISKPPIFFAHKDAVDFLISALNKTEGANVALVGPPGVGKQEIIRNFASHVVTGYVPKKLRFRRVVLFNGVFLVSASKQKGEFEEKLLAIFEEAEHAKNIVLVIDAFPEFVKSAEALGSDITSLLEKYFNSKRLVIIGLSDDFGYHEVIEKNSQLSSHFERLLIEEPKREDLLRILEEEIQKLEQGRNFLFTYSAIKVLADGTKRYFPDGVLPERAIDLARSVVSFAGKYNVSIIREDEVLAEIRNQTSIPVGKIDEEEKEKLLNLEAELHKRVIGQNEAISAISNALRRSRTDIAGRKRPMGSFLFLGPTGVGKTETAKALAQVFFGGEAHLRRLDMSEYKENDSIERLIGSFETQKPGVLANLLREHPYGVLLLDEFEKANKDVHDLFLQILDEGFFSDMNGKKVNARNTIFIATSNAGSAKISEAVNAGKELVSMKDEIIDMLISQAMFRPEFLNRFDAVVLFHPLGNEHLTRVATLLLEELAERLRDQNIHLVINEALINAMVRFGYDPKFGAREMRRAVQDKIENLIAQKIIKGEIAPGEDLTLTPEELA